MDRTMEFEGKDVEEALERAAAELGLRPEELKYEIIDDGKKGFLGIGSRRARIRVPGSVRNSAPPAAASPGTEAAATKRPAPSDRSTAYSRQEALREVAGKILREMKLDLSARLSQTEDSIVLLLGGRDASLLVENDGEGLEALQHILNKILSRDPRFDLRVVVDCGGFRRRRDEEIVERARQAADQVRATGTSAHLDGLNSYERRLVHLALADQKGLRTYSTGEGATKRLVIEPVEAPGPAKKA